MDALQQLIPLFVAFVPRLLGTIVVLLIGYFLAKFVASLVRRLLVAVGIDKLTERLQTVDIISKAQIEIKLSRVVSQLLFYFIMLIVLVAATDILQLGVVSALVASAIIYLPNLVAALIILVIGAILADALKNITVVTCRSMGIPAAGMIGSIIFWFVFIAILISALNQAQFKTEFIVANLSILVAGVALAFALSYGLAAKPLMGGFLAQFYNRGKFNVGDTIRIEANEGVILSIDRASFTLSSNDQLIIIPLSKLQTETIHVIERGDYGDPLLRDGRKAN